MKDETSAPRAESLRVTIEVLLRPEAARAALIAEAKKGLTATPKELSPKWFYDEVGSALFDEITRLPEYYPTRREREILLARAKEIALSSRADTLVELGSGTSEKTLILLDAFHEAATLQRFCPFDVSESTLRDAADRISRRYEGVRIHGVVGDFDHHLGQLPRGGTRMIAFLGGTIGNFKPASRRSFLSTLAEGMQSGDTLLLGTDLLKDRARLHAAYNDSAGITARFNKNVLAVLNRSLGASFDERQFDHVARFDEAHGWIEMILRSRVAQTIPVKDLGLDVSFAAGEELRTEVSTKFSPERVRRELTELGLEEVAFWTDAAVDFALSLWRKP